MGILVRLGLGPTHPAVPLIAFTAIAVLAAIPWIVKHSASQVLPTYLLLAVPSATILTINYLSGGLASPSLVFMPLMPLLATLLLGIRAGLLTAGCLSAGLALMALLPLPSAPSVEAALQPGGDHLVHASLTSLTMVLVTLLGGLYDRQRLEAERAERETETLHRRLFEQSKDVVGLSTADGRLLDINQAGVELFGFSSKDELLRVHLPDFYADPAERERAVDELEEHGYVRAYPLHLELPDGRSLTVQATTSTIRDPGTGRVDYMLAILRDVTEQEQIIAERESLIQELGVKNAELERFTHSVSHDLKSPLITIKGFLGLLERDLQASDLARAHQDLRVLARTTDQMQRLVDDLLEVARLGREGRPWVDVDLHELVAEVTERLAGRILERGLTLEVASDLPRVHGDPAQLGAVFQNLIDNAIKFAHTETPQVEIGWRPGTEPLADNIFFVRDNGPGVDIADRTRIFGLFEQAVEPKAPRDLEVACIQIKGTGVGLAIVERVVALHGGRIWIEDGLTSVDQDPGAAFCFTLPGAPSTPQSIGASTSTSPDI